jgi:hypothetical protein
MTGAKGRVSMQGLLQRLVRKVVWWALGLVVTLVLWSIRGGDGREQVKGIPDKVWEGGAGTMTIDVETSCPARMSVTFSEDDEEDEDVNDDEPRSLNAWEKIEAGSHSWTIDLPPGAGGYVDLTAEDPEEGAQLSWVIRVNDVVMTEESQTLDDALPSNYAFGLQLFMDDYSSASLD